MSARIVEVTGFGGIWASGLTMSASLGVRDHNEASWTQLLEALEFMSDASSLPILLDGDTGYGNFNNMRRLVRKLEQRNIAGVCIEDKLFPKTNSFINGDRQPLADIDEFCGKIKAAKDTQADEDFWQAIHGGGRGAVNITDVRYDEITKSYYIGIGVPVLEEDGFCLWESPAILKYLAAKRPEKGLGGRDAKEAALIDQWLFWWTGGPEAAIDALAWEQFIKPNVLKKPGNDPGIIADAHARLARFLPVLDKQLKGRDYAIGPLSILDFAIGARLDRAPELLKFDIAPYPNIIAWRERLRAKPYWATA